MAVYTNLSRDDIETLLAEYNIGTLVSFEEIAEGVENSNFLLITRHGARHERYILTLYEKRVKVEELPFFTGLMQHFAARQLDCPLPIADKQGRVLQKTGGKTALIVSFLKGKGVRRSTNGQMTALGSEVARLHLAVTDFPLTRRNDLSPSHLTPLFEKVQPRLDALEPGLANELEDELGRFSNWESWPLPRGVIHADIFPDNVFFIDDTLTGVIDFYFACEDFFAYDLAICLNAWCFEGKNEFNITKAQCLMNAYHGKRLLTGEEMKHLPLLARGAAVRFLLTRAHDLFFPVEGALVTPKDPHEYIKKWKFHRRVEHCREYGL